VTAKALASTTPGRTPGRDHGIDSRSSSRRPRRRAVGLTATVLAAEASPTRQSSPAGRPTRGARAREWPVEKRDPGGERNNPRPRGVLV
jgi:hypothetical protein